MAVITTQWLPVALLLSCLASFAWAMQRFFVRPAGTTAGMRTTIAASFLCSVIHVITVIWPGNITPARGIAGSVLYVLALAVFWWALLSNRRIPLSGAYSPDLPAHLNQDGPYRYVRHPFYCSYLTTWIAGFVATAAWWLLPTIILMIAIYIHAARTEEAKFESSRFAEMYAAYRRRTGLFVPNPAKMLTLWRSR